ncbi:hypothetical protein M758_6G082600 [Ceratodon purpureus]|nr:hypothetical protein M758_6G082600 [Ceratodon purpureus]
MFCFERCRREFILRKQYQLQWRRVTLKTVQWLYPHGLLESTVTKFDNPFFFGLDCPQNHGVCSSVLAHYFLVQDQR